MKSIKRYSLPYFVIQPTNFNNLNHEEVYLRVSEGNHNFKLLQRPRFPSNLLSESSYQNMINCLSPFLNYKYQFQHQVRFCLVLLALATPICTLVYTRQRGGDSDQKYENTSKFDFVRGGPIACWLLYRWRPVDKRHRALCCLGRYIVHSTFTCFSVNNHSLKEMSLFLNKTKATFHHNKCLLSVRCNSNSDGSFRGSHEASSEKGSATRTTWRSKDINISMRFNINIFKQHDQQHLQ